MTQLLKCFPHVSKMPSLTNKWVSSAVIRNALILNIINITFNLRETESCCISINYNKYHKKLKQITGLRQAKVHLRD